MVKIMKPALKLAALIFALAPFLPVAEAANPGGPLVPRVVQGWVVGVRFGNGGGILQVRTGQRMNNLGPANLQAIAPVTRNFAIGPATYFEVARGAIRMPASAAVLRPGQRIMVQTQGEQALGVQIIARAQNGGVRRGVYYAGRGPSVARGNHAVQLPRQSTTPKAAKPAGANLHHASMIGGAPHIVSKKR
jgi:hypothetical protein